MSKFGHKWFDREAFNAIYKYSKYSSVATQALDKLFRRKVAPIRFAEAVSTGVFDLCKFVNTTGFISTFENLYKLDSQYCGLVALVIDGLEKKFAHQSDHNQVYYECKLYNKYVIVSYNTYRNEISEIYCYKEDSVPVREEIKEIFWKKFTNNIIVGMKLSLRRYEEEENLFARPDKLEQDGNYFSKEYYDANDYVKKYFEKNKSRAIIFYGRPGTGKSTIIRQIAKNLNARTIRISIDSFKDFSLDTMGGIVQALQPEILIIDDFDRLEMTPSMLPIFESLHNQLKVIMISVNNKNYFDKNKAMVRPGRFDKWIKVESLDDAVIEKIIGKEYMHLKDKIKDFPAAFIKELKENIEVLGADGIDDYIKELQERVNYQNQEQEDKS